MYNDKHPYLKVASVSSIKSLNKGAQQSSPVSDILAKSSAVAVGPTKGTFDLFTIQGELKVFQNEIKFKLDVDRSFEHLYVLDNNSTMNADDLFLKPSENTNMSFDYKGITYYCTMNQNYNVSDCKNVIACV